LLELGLHTGAALSGYDLVTLTALLALPGWQARRNLFNVLTVAVRAQDGGAGLLAARREHTRGPRHLLLTKREVAQQPLYKPLF